MSLPEPKPVMSEAEATLDAIRNGEVDAVVVRGPRGDRVHTLSNVDEPYRLFVESMQEGALTLTLGGTILFGNPAIAALLGAPLHEIIGGPIGPWIHETDRILVLGLLAEGINGGGRREVRFRSARGEVIATLVSVRPMALDDKAGLCAVVTDLSERKRQEAMAEAERLARSILDHATEPVVVCDPTGRLSHASLSAQRLCNRPVIGLPFAEAFPLEADAGLDSALTAALRGEVVRGTEGRLPLADGTTGHFLVSAGPLHGPERIIGSVVTLTNITQRKDAERHQSLLLAELSHRVKNVLQTVLSIAQWGWHEGQTIAGFRETFDGRITALAVAHQCLAETNWRGIRLRTLIESQLDPYRSSRNANISIDGDEFMLGPRGAQTFGMAIHELATNAAKYGALSSPGGSVAVSWRLTASPNRRLHIVWTERGGPSVPPPTRRGFGRLLIEQALAAEFDGVVRLEFTTAGVTCTFDLPGETTQAA